MRGRKGVADGDVRGDHDDEYDDMEDSNESLEELFVMERTANRFPSAGDDVVEASEEAGLGQALATRTPGPKMSLGGADPLHFGIGTGAGTKETGVDAGLGNIMEGSLGFTDWSGSN